jgi:hypothetical protein
LPSEPVEQGLLGDLVGAQRLLPADPPRPAVPGDLLDHRAEHLERLTLGHRLERRRRDPAQPGARIGFDVRRAAVQRRRPLDHLHGHLGDQVVQIVQIVEERPGQRIETPGHPMPSLKRVPANRNDLGKARPNSCIPFDS